ncbi:TetR/AcrR family transcriptional regulator [Ornithinibacillus californiensis]|uniref:TetR/AcrR family transcriptional regulator n=1 Tax=Ornithinibacillus californiensis TaxID=161536 RepID=UPI00064DCF78|nr:TetR-like C-terminal domain-containing protein [Ornithinibacillus californiensis]
MPRVGLDLSKIIQAAAKIVDEQGVEAITLAAIARDLSVKPPSLFNHVQGLSQIKRELSLIGVKMLYDTMQPASDGKLGDEAIFALANAYLQFTRDHPGLYEFTIALPHPKDEEIEKEGNKIIALITEALRNYQLSEENAIHAVRGLRSILHGFSSLEQKGGFGMPLRKEESLNLVIKAFLTGLDQIK